MPPLVVAAPGWESVEIGSFCLDLTVSGSLEPMAGAVEPWVFMTRLVEAAGFEVVTAGCDATLQVGLHGEMIGANYVGAGICYMGWDTSAFASLSAEGRAPLSASAGDRQDPPESIPGGSCNKSAVIPARDWSALLVGEGDDGPGVVSELLGDRIVLSAVLAAPVAEAGVASAGRDLLVRQAEIDDTVVALLSRALLSADRDTRISAAGLIADTAEWRGSRVDLEPVVPYLIWALAEEDGNDLETSGTLGDGEGDMRYGRAFLGSALEAVTGKGMAARADLWWDWWQSRR